MFYRHKTIRTHQSKSRTEIMYYLPLEISFLGWKPKKGPWPAASSFFCLKYSWSSLAFCLWNSTVTTPLPSTATVFCRGGDGGGEEDGTGGTGFCGGEGSRRVGGAEGLLNGPSAWEHLMTKTHGLIVENLKDDEVVEEEEDGLRILIHWIGEANDIFR